MSVSKRKNTKQEYYAVECTLNFGATRYFCAYWILDERELRLCKEKKDAIFYSKRELLGIEVEILSSMKELEISKYKFIKV